MIDKSSLLNGYRDRVARIALFDIFTSIEKKQRKDNKGKPVDFFGLGLLTLLFFFENMLMRKKKVGSRELAAFLYDMNNDHMDLTIEEFQEIARSIIESFRPASGKRNKREFYNYETGQLESVEYAILKADTWDRENNIQYYVLDEQGLELIFATKEYFSEFQISISQLVLRKQLEKGEFSGALRQIDEMRINVGTIKEKIHTIKHDIQRNIISDDTYERYKELISDINRRLEREHEEFEELSDFIKETKNHLDYNYRQAEKDKKALELIVKIDNELAQVHSLHSNLLKESIELKTTALEAAGESLYYVGLTSFNFDQEITRKMMTSPLPFESSKLIASPFLKLQKQRTWSLLTVFSEQQVEKEQENKVKNEFLSVNNDGITKELEVQQKTFAYIFKEIMMHMGVSNKITLSEITRLKNNKLFGTREFYDFWIILHQVSPLKVKEIVESKEHIFSRAFEKIMDYDAVRVIELKEEINFNEHYSVKDMELELISGDENDA